MKVKIRTNFYNYSMLNVLNKFGFRQPSGRDVFDNSNYNVGILIDTEEKIARFLKFENAFRYHRVKEITEKDFFDAYNSYTGDLLKIGSEVIVINNGKAYSGYDTWRGLKGYEDLFTRGESPVNGNVYTILNVDFHENEHDILCLIKDSIKNRVYIIDELGLEIVTEN